MEPRWRKNDKLGFSYMRTAANLSYYDQKRNFTPIMNKYNLDTVIIVKNEKKIII